MKQYGLRDSQCMLLAIHKSDSQPAQDWTVPPGKRQTDSTCTVYKSFNTTIALFNYKKAAIVVPCVTLYNNNRTELYLNCYI